MIAAMQKGRVEDETPFYEGKYKEREVKVRRVPA